MDSAISASTSDAFTRASVRRRRFPFGMARFFQIGLALLLFTAAALKCYGLLYAPLRLEVFGASPRLELLAIEIETLLGLWLLTGRLAAIARMVATAWFSVLALASLRMALRGEPSCGCLGPVAISPWLTFGLDFTLIVGLLVWRPRVVDGWHPRPWLKPAIRIATGAALFTAALAAFFFTLQQKPGVGLARLRGESVIVEPAVASLGSGHRGESRAIHFMLRNRTDKAIRITGGTSNCSCLATNDLPLLIPAGESAPIAVTIFFKGPVGDDFQRAFYLYTDDDRQPMAVARFAGHVVEADK